MSETIINALQSLAIGCGIMAVGYLSGGGERDRKEHRVTKNYKTVLVYDQCESCGRNNYRHRAAVDEAAPVKLPPVNFNLF